MISRDDKNNGEVSKCALKMYSSMIFMHYLGCFISLKIETNLGDNNNSEQNVKKNKNQ